MGFSRILKMQILPHSHCTCLFFPFLKLNLASAPYSKPGLESVYAIPNPKSTHKASVSGASLPGMGHASHLHLTHVLLHEVRQERDPGYISHHTSSFRRVAHNREAMLRASGGWETCLPV